LRELTNAGLITARREGTNVYYRIRNILLVQAFHDLVAALDKEYASRMSGPIGEEVS